MYIVRCNIRFGYDDTYDCEYSGIEHKTRDSAEKELKKAKAEDKVLYAYIKSTDDD